MNKRQIHLKAIKANLELGNLACAKGQAEAYSKTYKTTASQIRWFGLIDELVEAQLCRPGCILVT